MRNAMLLGILGALSLPAAAHPDCHGYDYGHRYHARPYRAVHTAYRVSNRHGFYHYQRRWARAHHRYGHYGHGCYAPPVYYAGCHDGFRGFSHGYGHGYAYGSHVYYGFSPHVRSAELLSRLGAVFTVEGGAAADVADHDGVPRAPSRLVGARFVE